MPDRTDHEPAMPGDVPEHAEMEQEVRQLLQDLGARPRNLELTQEEQDRTGRAASSALAAILSSPSSDTPSQRTPAQPVATRSGQDRERRPLRGWVLTAAAALVVAIASVPIVRIFSEHTDPAVASTPAMAQFDPGGREHTQTADDVLITLADSASKQPWTADLPVQLIATQTWHYAEQEPTALTAVPSERYLLSDGTVRLIEREAQPLDPDGRISTGIDTKSLPITSDESFPGPETGPEYPSTLSTDPTELVKQLIPEPHECEQTSACLVQAIVKLHTSYVLPPTLSAALWTTLADAGQAEYLGQTRDRLDRPAVALRVPTSDADHYTVIYADPTSGALLGTDLILTRDDRRLNITAPAVVGFTAITLAQRVSNDEVP